MSRPPREELLTVRFSSLASSSKAGNAYLVEGGDGTRVLVDCGLGIRRLEERLLGFGVAPSSLAAVLLTHNHWDHVRALCLKNPFTAKHGVPLYASGALLDRLGQPGAHPVVAERPFRVGGFDILAFRKPHDCLDPFGYVLDDGESRLAVVTDLGHVSAEMVDLLYDCAGLIFEANHDVELELESGRPLALVERVLGDHGHLSNDQAGRALAAIAGPSTAMILLAHLSEECNTPALALAAVRAYLDQAGYGGGLAVAPLFLPSPFISASISWVATYVTR